MTLPVVTARGLRGGYGRNNVLKDIDLTIPVGTTALLGPNGAGKSTLLNMICGLKPVHGGSLEVMGVDRVRRNSRREIASMVGYLPQKFGYLPSYSVRDFVTYAAWLKMVPEHRSRERVDAVIDDVEMSEWSSSKLRTLSGGMLRRVGIAASIVHEPKLLILDEPSAGLDPEQRIQLRQLLARISDQTSIILSTHIIEDVKASCNSVLVLDRGRIRFAGPTAELEVAHRRRGSDQQPSIEDGYIFVLGSSTDRRRRR